MSSQLPAFRSTLHVLMAGYQERMAARIRAERKSRGLSREEAAHAAGISFRQYQRWETGQSEPRDVALARLATAWKIPLEDLRPPDPEHEEREVRDQLDRLEENQERMEAKLDQLLSVLTQLAAHDGDDDPFGLARFGQEVRRLGQRASSEDRREAEEEPAPARRQASR